MISRRHWVTAGAISVATTVVIAGLVVVTQPRGGDQAADPSALVVAASPAPPDYPAGSGAPATATAEPRPTTVRPSAPRATTRPPAATRKATPAEAAKAPTRKKARAEAPKRAGGGSSGTGRIRRGRTYPGDATYYAATGAGNCSYDASSNLMVGAMNQQDYENAQACGAYLAVTGPSGTVTIRVVDRCPECPPGAIDLSRQAFAKIAPVSAGKVRISWTLLSPGSKSPVAYRYKSGSSRYWCGIQVLDHRNPVRSLQVRSGGSWKTLARQEYNYFVSQGGSGCGGPIRVTDIYGNRLTDAGIRIDPGAVQRGQGQFPSP